MNKVLRKTSLCFFLLFAAASTTYCNPVRFSANNTSGANLGPGFVTTTGGGVCGISNIQVPVKVLFVVDVSGSNNSETQDDGTTDCTDPSQQTCSPPTDPNKTFRGGSITNFFNANQSDSVFSWGFVVFSESSASPYITNSSGNAIFGNSTQMQSALNQFNSETDDGGTPYLAALNAAAIAISNDPGLNLTGNQAPVYEIIFLSDGYPTDALSSSNPVTVNTAEIDSAINNITSLAPGRVFLSSVYYGTINDPHAASTLQNMATTGSGQFVNADTGNTSTIVIDNLITIPTGDCQ